MTREEIREGILKEVCCICVHKPTHKRASSFEADKTVQVYGSDCSYGYTKDSNRYCSLAHKVTKAIMQKLHSQGVVIKAGEERPMTIVGSDKTIYGVAVEPLIEETR